MKRIALIAGAAVLLTGLSAGSARAQGRLLARGGFAFPMGDYDQTSEGLDMYAKAGWTGGLELRLPLVENMNFFVSYDRIVNGVDEDEVEAAIGTTEELSADSHVADVALAGIRFVGSPVPNATLAIHGGVGLASFQPGSYSVEGAESSFDSARRMTLAGGFSLTMYRVEAAFRFYPLGTFEHDGRILIGDDEFEREDVQAPVKAMTLTLGFVLF